MDFKTALSYVPVVTKFVVSKSVSFVLATALASLVPTEKKIEKIGFFIGSWAIVSHLHDKFTATANTKIDNAIVSLSQARTKFHEMQKK